MLSLHAALFIVALAAVACAQSAPKALPQTCGSPVYCYGELLHTVQMARVFKDSKTFVDLKMVHNQETTLANFERMMNQTDRKPSPHNVTEFVHANFMDAREMEGWKPPDFNPEPRFLQKIADPTFRDFARKVVALWKTLARKVKPDVFNNPEQYSLVPIDNGFIIPGGRFKEIYYWDTYWIVRGLLLSEMSITARGMIENLIQLVKKFGHVPNGSRVYYEHRSQPPLLTKMAFEYFVFSNNITWIRQHINTLEEELRFWDENRQKIVYKNGYRYKLYHYYSPSLGPRPESYREDMHTASFTADPNATFAELKSGAESGWDYSSRWIFDESGGVDANLSSIQVSRVIPVDLNSYLYDAFNLISKMFFRIGDTRYKYWHQRAEDLGRAITKVLWNKDEGIWEDYDSKMDKPRNFFYISHITPAWVGLGEGKEELIERYLKKLNISSFLGGTPTSFVRTGEQWDWPNAWPPCQGILIQGLKRLGTETAVQFAQELAQHWVQANFIGFSQTNEMFEKYDAEVPGQYGGGGEYDVQSGFGWTNGILLNLMNDYGNKLKHS